MFCLRDTMKSLPVLVDASCGKFQNSENYPCFLISTVFVYTLISHTNYCTSATASSGENFAVIFLNTYYCGQLQLIKAHNRLCHTVKHLMSEVL